MALCPLLLLRKAAFKKITVNLGILLHITKWDFKYEFFFHILMSASMSSEVFTHKQLKLPEVNLLPLFSLQPNVAP